ncbi:S8 family serine peptidase [Streptomyces sp. NPDC002088]|uniref:S8 family serine peptidase n=1 Tax=Streptomyces sp. NPDC002088 TaxID=3154665 RepID=UPI00332B722D
MRRLHALWAVAGTAGLLAGAIAPAAAARPLSSATKPSTGAAATARSTQIVTLITGDTVSLTEGADGKSAVDVQRGQGREGVGFVTTEQKGEVSVVPDDAMPLVQAGRLDPTLFNITQLVKQGYGDKGADKTTSIPLIATYQKGKATAVPEGARKTLALPGIHGAALSAKKADAEDFWTDIAPASAKDAKSVMNSRFDEGIDKLWLDAKAEVALDVSVPQIGAPELWKAGYDGKGVKIAVLDTGADTGHPDLAGKITESKSFVPDQEVQDGHGHGTHVASTIVGSGAASGGKYKGVAPGADLMVGKVLDNSGSGQDSWIIAGMEWAANSGADVISMSLGGTAYAASDPVSETVDALSASTGALFVIAAGNSGPYEQSIGTPGIADSALTVGAVSKTDQLASFSSRGPRTGDYGVKPEITAPGVDIVAARAAGTALGTPVDDNYTSASGTSMATPHVAGAAALVAQAHPDWTNEQLKAALASTAKTNTTNSVFQQGDGRVDVVRAATQDVFATPTLNFGLYVSGEDTEADSKDITYTNATDVPVTLKLTSSLTDDSLSLGATEVTVPAEGTATVPVTVDPLKAEEARYSGYITATAEGVTVTTGVGYEKQPKMYNLKVNVLDRDGAAPPYALFAMQDLNSTDANASGYMPGTWTWKVPAGTYSFATWIPEMDAGGSSTGTSVVGDPQIEVTGDTELTLDARKAVEIKPVTKERDASYQGYVTSWHREGPGSNFGVTYSETVLRDHVYVAPTEQVTQGTFDFYAKFRLYAKELTASVTSPESYSLKPLYTSTYSGYPVKITGDRTVRAVDAGSGTAADFAGLDVKGKAVVVGLGATEGADEALANATAAGAGYLIAYRKTPGRWAAAVDSATIPVITVPGEEGEKLTSLLKSSGKVTLKLGGTEISPYVYNLVFPQSGAISADQTYMLDSTNLTKQKVRYHAGQAGQITQERLYTYRPWQRYDIDAGHDLYLGTERTEYYNTDPDTRVWHNVAAAYDSLQSQWSTLRTYDKAGTEPTEDWFRQVVRPATNAAYGLSQRTGDKLTFLVPELSDSTPGHYGSVDGIQATSKGTLYADGTPVGNPVSPYGGRGTFNVTAAEASYRFVLDTQRTADWAPYSTSTHTEWSFASAHTDTKTALPLLSVDYAVQGLDLLNRAEGPDSELGLSVRNQEGGVEPLGLKAWVSYDDGTSWKEAKVQRGADGYLTKIKNVKGADFVSLRILATDAAGNQVDQTVLRAYGLR